MKSMDNMVFAYENQKKFTDIVEVPLSKRFQLNGVIVTWKFQRIDTHFDNQLVDASYCYSKETNTRVFDEQDYVLRFLTASCVYPDLEDAALQESYGVAKPSDLLISLLSDPDEYKEAYQKVKQALNAALEEEYNREQEKKFVEDEFYE